MFSSWCYVNKTKHFSAFSVKQTYAHFWTSEEWGDFVGVVDGGFAVVDVDVAEVTHVTFRTGRSAVSFLKLF